MPHLLGSDESRTEVRVNVPVERLRNDSSLLQYKVHCADVRYINPRETVALFKVIHGIIAKGFNMKPDRLQSWKLKGQGERSAAKV